MGYCNRRTDRFGQPRYTAMFLDTDGKHHSAGTYGTKKEAREAWQAAESKVREGRGHHLVRGRVLFRVYVEQDWLPNLTVGTKTRENYSYELYAHIMPFFGEKRMLDIRASEIKRWLTELKEAGVSPASRKYLKALLSTIFSNAVREEIVPGNPCLLVKTEKVPKKHLDIITPTQFDRFYTALVDQMWKLLVETAIETGMRWGELTELRVKDFDHGRNLLKVSRAVVQVSPRFHPEGGRFLVKPPKNHEQRVVKIAQHLADKIDAHISHHDLKSDDLLFWYAPAKHRSNAKTLEPKSLGWTEPNENGRIYRHGTTSAYAAAQCRCEHCREAVAAYRRKRRANGKDSPRKPRRWDTDGHTPARWFRDTIIKPALKEAGLPVDIRMHLLRHAHASWLLNGGADLMVVKERLGHASILTTERYLHTVENADETALGALDKMRNPRSRASESPESIDMRAAIPQQRESLSNEELLTQMTALQAELTKRLGGPGGEVAAA